MASKYGFINKSGQFVIDPIFDNAFSFDGGIAAVEIGGKWGYIDKAGCVVVEPLYEEVSCCFSEGLAWVLRDNQYFFVDKNGNEVIGPIETSDYTEVGLFHEGLAYVHQGLMKGYINKRLQVVITPTFDFVEVGPFCNGIARVECKGRKMGLIDMSGQFVLSPKYDWISDKCIEGIYRTGIKIGSEGRLGFVDAKGKVIVEPKFEESGDFSEGLCAVKSGAKYGYIDKSCNFVIQPSFDKVKKFSEGLAPAFSGKKWGYIDKTGNFLIEPQFDSAESFFGGYAYVKIGDKDGVIDKSGRVLFEPQYVKSFFRDFSESMAVIRNNDNKYGYIDITRHTAIEPVYHFAREFQEGLACVESESQINSAVAFKRLPRRHAQKEKVSSPQRSVQSHSYSTQGAKQSSGCYVATAVYGSYDCPEVWTLRRYRDNVLDSTWFGRLFIRTYYAISPTLVKWFGATEWFRGLFRAPLSKWVRELNRRGFEDSPYEDKY